MKIFVINGPPEAGKDEFIKFVENNYDGDIYNFSSIDPVKAAAKELKWNGEKDDKARAFLVDIKQAWIKYNNGPTRYSIDTIIGIAERVYKRNLIIFVHIREPEEIQKLKWFFPDLKTLFLDRPVIRRTVGNLSDDGVDNMEYDIKIVIEGGLNKLQEAVKDFLRRI